MMKEVPISIAEIYVPARLRSTLDEAKVGALAEDIMENGQQTAISVRKGDKRYVLVSGLHRLEACKALGEETIKAIVVGARQFCGLACAARAASRARGPARRFPAAASCARRRQRSRGRRPSPRSWPARR